MSKKNILIIDDDTLLCWALSRRISIMGINAVTASTGKDALIKIEQKIFDIIFVDVNLPDINGIELLEKIQKISLLSKLIVITSEINEEYRRAAVSKGAFDFIEKPFGFSEIKKVINSIFSIGMEKRKYQRFTCNIPCNISILKKSDEKEPLNNNFLYGTAIDINKKGLGMKFKDDISSIAKGKLVRLLTGVRDHSIFDFLPSNIIAEIVWVKKQGCEILAGLRYLSSSDNNRIFET